jgi:hypothetical protein
MAPRDSGIAPDGQESASARRGGSSTRRTDASKIRRYRPSDSMILDDTGNPLSRWPPGLREDRETIFLEVDLGVPTISNFVSYLTDIEHLYLSSVHVRAKHAPPVMQPETPGLSIRQIHMASPLEAALTAIAGSVTPVAYIMSGLFVMERCMRLLMDWQVHRADLAERAVREPETQPEVQSSHEAGVTEPDEIDRPTAESLLAQGIGYSDGHTHPATDAFIRLSRNRILYFAVGIPSSEREE